MAKAVNPRDITGLVLAGGRGSRMGGVDKGLQTFHGQPLAQHALQRLAPQVGQLLINANRNLDTYALLAQPWAAKVCADDAALGEFAGPLAGFLTGLAHCSTPYLLTVPCDTPLFPADLAARMAAALQTEGADMAMALAPEEDGALRKQPVFCLMHTRVLASLQSYTQGGGRKIDTWTAQQHTVLVPFDKLQDDPRAFFNANTLDELQRLQDASPPHAP